MSLPSEDRTKIFTGEINIVGMQTTGNVIATSSTGEVLVKDASGKMVWQQGTPEQIAEANRAINDGGTYNKPYVSPEQKAFIRDAEETKPGAAEARVIARQSQEPVFGVSPIPAGTVLGQNNGNIIVKSEVGNAVKLTRDQANLINNSPPRGQLSLLQQYGIIDKDAVIRDEDIKSMDNWSFVPGHEVRRVAAEQKQIDEENKRIEAAQQELMDFENKNTKLPDDLYMANEDLSAVKKETPDLYDILTSKGYEAYKAEVEKRQPKLTGFADIDKLSPGGGNAEWIYKGKRISTLEREQIIANYERERDRLAKEGKIGSPEWLDLAGHNPENAMVRTPGAAKVAAKNTAVFAAEVVVPGLYTAKHWNELSAGEKAVQIIFDAATVVPFVTAPARAAKTVGTASRIARLTAAAKAVGTEAIVQARAPIDMVIHPVGTAKATAAQVKALATNIAHAKKIPEAVLTTSSGTVRLKITKNMSASKAIAARDEIVALASRGERPQVIIDGNVIELRQSALMKELKGGLTHATPSGEAFESGLVVARKPGMPETEQGLFWSPEPAVKFTSASAFGKTGQRPTIIIASADIAKPTPTGKIYRMTAEMEAKSPVGVELPKNPTQHLITHVGPNAQRVDILLYGKKLSPAQIAKLKAQGLVEAIKEPFRPPIKITSKTTAPGAKGLTKKQTKALANMLDDIGEPQLARSLTRSERIAASARLVAPTLARFSSKAVHVRRVDAATVDRKYAPVRAVVNTAIRPARLYEPVRGSRLPVAIRAERLQTPEARVNVRANTERPPELRSSSIRPGSRSEIQRPELRLASSDRITRADVDLRPPRTPPPSEKTSRVDTPETPKQAPIMGQKASMPTREQLRTAVSWRQGIGWWVVYKDNAGKTQNRFFMGNKPPEGVRPVPGGIKSAYRSIQLKYGNSPQDIDFNMGIVRANISRPSKVPGRVGAISFNRTRAANVSRRPNLDISKKGRLYYLKGMGVSRRKPHGRIVR